MTVWILWDTSNNTIAYDPLARLADGLCPLAVYSSEAFAGRAADACSKRDVRVEIRQTELRQTPPVADGLDEIEPWISPEVALVCAGSLPRHAPLRGGLDTFERDE